MYFCYDKNISLVGFNLNDKEYPYVKNAQGDITGILDKDGRQVVSYTYDAWGKVESISGSRADTVGKINPMRYRGYYEDTETGWYYLQSRYYNPEMSRFINADEPVMFELNVPNLIAANLFTYCMNNPIKYSDPNGHWVVSAGLEIGAAFVLGLYLAVSVNYDGTWLSVSLSLGVLVITNASAYFSGYFLLLRR